MSGLDKDRHRNITVSFRVSPEEGRQLDARVKISGLHKNEYIISSLLHGPLSFSAGKFESDRLSVELKRLREQLECQNGNFEETLELLKSCKALLDELSLLTRKQTSIDQLKKESTRSIN